MSELLTIGEFATATGSRRYSPHQIETARLISMLRRIDMPLPANPSTVVNSPIRPVSTSAHIRWPQLLCCPRRGTPLPRNCPVSSAPSRIDSSGSPKTEEAPQALSSSSTTG